MITIEMLIKTPSLKGMKIIAGKEGAAREVTAVSVLDAPDSYKWLKGGELILTSGYMFGEDVRLLELFLDNLIKAGASGLGIKKERFLSKVPESIVRIANKNQFPVLEIPYQLVWSDVISRFYRLHHGVPEKGITPLETDVIRQVYRAARWGSRPLLEKLTELFNVPLLVIDESRKMLMDNGHPEIELMAETIKNSPLFPENMETETLTSGIYHLTVCPIPFSKKGQKGYITVMSQSSSFIKGINKLFQLLSTFDERKDSRTDDLTEAYRKFIQSLITGHLTQEAAEGFREYRDTQETIYTSVVMIRSGDAFSVYQQLDDILKSPRFSGAGKTITHIVEDTAKQEAVILLELYLKDDHETLITWQHRLVEELEYRMQDAEKGYVTMGRFYEDLEDVALSLSEAKDTFSVWRSIWKGRHCFLYSDLSVYNVLRKIDPNQFDLSDIQLLDGNKTSFSFDGIKTLETFLECQGYKKAAEALYVHENTLRYRMQKIEEFLCVDLNDPMVAHILFIQLKLWKLIKRRKKLKESTD
ncbi:MAG: PucR family transcriptional regulator [Coriobacteriales bacterium]|nr:PucR family transcriptional regulator [Coriobacteriales bacterium]